MGMFEQWGVKLDDLMGKVKEVTQEGAGKTAREAGEWGKKLSELGEVIRKTTQEGLEKFTAETRDLTQIARLRSQVRQVRAEMEKNFRQMGEKTYELLSKKVIENADLKGLGERISELKEDIQKKEEQIKKLKKREE